jgi:predicted flap endonuclease-1-like 5' DNA nuclease/glutathione synthase/RimK-type ligase-like ATP-grasp enzyme
LAKANRNLIWRKPKQTIKNKKMKKIGVLFGMEDSFPWALIDRINMMNVEGVMAEAVMVDQVIQGEPTGYAVIIDRISQDVPFYRAYLKNASITGTAVINNPFWWSADEKFFNNALALKVGVPVPKTVLLPSKERPSDTSEKSFRNLKYPISWEAIFKHIGFPAYMKPHSGGGWKSVYKVRNPDELFKAYDETGQLVMMLQENIDFTDYYRCYYVGGRVRVMPYEPRNPHHLRYVQDAEPNPATLATIEDYVIRLCEALGYDFNTVEFAVRDGVPYAIDFCNPAPDADIHSVGKANFDWVVENMAEFAIERALEQEPDLDNLTWGMFVENGVFGGDLNIEKAVENPAGMVADEIISILEDELEDAIQEIFEGLTPEQIEQVMDSDFVEELAEEAMEEILEEIEELFEEGGEDEDESEDGEASSDDTEEDEEAEEAESDEDLEAELEAVDAKTTLFAVIGTAEADGKDDLKKIKGVGPKVETILNEIGIFTFAQLSKMTEKEYDILDSLLPSFRGRNAIREDWAGQAAKFLA